MEESTFVKLKEFIVELAGVGDKDITPDTRLYEDLDIYGDDAFDLLVKYGKKFYVDVSNFKTADYFKGEGWGGIGAIREGIARFLKRKISPSGLKVLTILDLEKGIIAGCLDENVIHGEIKKEGVCQVQLSYFQVEDGPIPKDRIVPMYGMHVLLNRDLLDHFPDKKYYDGYKVLLAGIPDTRATAIRQQLDYSLLQFYCTCGCHSFFVFPHPSAIMERLKGNASLEIEFETNYEEELNMHLFADSNGLIRQVTIYFGQNNLKPVPEDMQVGKIIGIW